MDTGRERQRKSLELKLPKPLLIKFSVSWLPSCSLLIFYMFDQYRLAEIFPFLEKKGSALAADPPSCRRANCVPFGRVIPRGEQESFGTSRHHTALV